METRPNSAGGAERTADLPQGPDQTDVTPFDDEGFDSSIRRVWLQGLGRQPIRDNMTPFELI